jgi:hypothetical protein
VHARDGEMRLLQRHYGTGNCVGTETVRQRWRTVDDLDAGVVRLRRYSQRTSCIAQPGHACDGHGVRYGLVIDELE